MVETDCIFRARRWAGFDMLRLCSFLACEGKGHGNRVKQATSQKDWDENLEVRLALACLLNNQCQVESSSHLIYKCINSARL